jgi:hypothetical protein
MNHDLLVARKDNITTNPLCCQSGGLCSRSVCKLGVRFFSSSPLEKIRKQNEELVQIEDMGQCFFYIHKRKQNIRKDLNVNKVYARLLCPQLTLDKPFGIVRQNRVR